MKWARVKRRKDRVQATWLRLLEWVWETAKRDRATKAGQQKTPWMGCVRCVCVCVFRAARTKKCQHFFFQVPISICIISFYRKLKRKAGDAGTKTQIDEETMVARRVDVWGRTFSKWWFHIVSRGFATARSGRGVCARGLTLSSRPLKKIMAFISLVSFFWLCRTPKLSSSR